MEEEEQTTNSGMIIQLIDIKKIEKRGAGFTSSSTHERVQPVCAFVSFCVFIMI